MKVTLQEPPINFTTNLILHPFQLVKIFQNIQEMTISIFSGCIGISNVTLKRPYGTVLP